MYVLAAFTLADFGRLIIICLLIMTLSAGLMILTGCKIPGRKPPIAALNPVRPHTFVDENGMHSWGFIARNGVEVHVSEKSFANKADLVAHYAKVFAFMQHAPVPDHLVPAGNRWRWVMFNEQEIKHLECSDQTFATQKAALENYSDLRKAVLACPPEHLTTLD